MIDISLLFEPKTLAAIVAWAICIVVTIICVSQIRAIYVAENHARHDALTVAQILAAILTVAILKLDIDSTITPYLQSPTTLAVSAATSGLIGWLLFKAGRIEKYGRFFLAFAYALVIGLSFYARIAAPSQIELCVAAFIVGALIHLVQYTVSLPDLPQRRKGERADRPVPNHKTDKTAPKDK